jgi:hypothetical protein
MVLSRSFKLRERIELLVLQYEGKQFNMTKAHMTGWDEVERERIKEWKQMLNTTKDKNKLSLYLWKRIVGGSLAALGFRIKVTDGKHRWAKLISTYTLWKVYVFWGYRNLVSHCSYSKVRR